MKRYVGTAIILALIACTSVANASITGVYARDDGDGVITCTAIWDNPSELLSIDGFHHKPNGFIEPGHVLIDVATDTPLDPTLTISNVIDNDTGVSWIGYHINVYMGHTFTISADNVTVPADWTSNITSQPVLVGSQYVGQIDYYAGTPLANGQTLAFGYAISFSGQQSYSFTQEMIPVAVPEPATLVLVSCGLVGLFVLRRRSA